MAVNDITDFKKFANKLHTYLIDKGYKMEHDNVFCYYFLGDTSLFAIHENNMTVWFRKTLDSEWCNMEFYDARPGSYCPDFELVKKYADKMIVEFKEENYLNKLKNINKDF